jgi:ABC-type branched-subunit amino acid transport system substrate-binding protein
MTRRSIKFAALAAAGLIATACASSAGSSGAGGSSSTNGGSILVGGLLPLTGAIANYGQWWAEGAQVGVAAVNAAGGVLGKKLVLQTVDTEGDPVDAVASLKALEVRNPAFIVGPSGPDILGPVGLFDKYQLPDFFIGGVTTLDTMTYKYVFRVSTSDSVASVAMADAAIKLGCRSAAEAFTNDANSQSERTAVTTAFNKLGGTIATSVSLTVPATSYLAEIQQLFSKPVQCVFVHVNAPANATFFDDAAQLGHLNLPYIGDPTFATQEDRQAMGAGPASKYMIGTNPVSPTGSAYQAYVAEFAKQFPGKNAQDAQLSGNMYDAVVIASLAMTKAKTTDPKVWVNDVVSVASGPGTVCYTYASCLSLLNSGKSINYDGAGGDENFNKYHNVFASFNVVGFTASGGLRTVLQISSSDLENAYKQIFG